MAVKLDPIRRKHLSLECYDCMNSKAETKDNTSDPSCAKLRITHNPSHRTRLTPFTVTAGQLAA